MNMLQQPVVLAPCAHVLCRDCSTSEERCPQCSRSIKDKLGPSDMLGDLVNKFTFSRDAIAAFKNESFWKSKQAATAS
jgi:hypothetical protein